MGSGSSSVPQSQLVKDSNAAHLALQSPMASENRVESLRRQSDAALHEAKMALRSSSLFENMDEKAANLVAPIIALQKIRAGATIATKGSKFDRILVLKSGTLAVIEIRDGFETATAELTKPFTVFGEQSFQNATPSEVTVKAKTASTIWQLEREEFEKLFKVSLQSFLESQRRKYKTMQMQLAELRTEHSKLPFQHQDGLDPLTRRVIVSKPALIVSDAYQFATVHADVRWDRYKRVLDFMKQGCPVDILDEKHNSLLIVAVQNGHLELARMFLELGAQIDWQNDAGATALHYALEYDYPRIARLLRANGASEVLLDAYGAPPSVGFTNRNSQSLSVHLPKRPIAKPHEHQPKSDFVRTFMMSNKLL
jgi:CRP-like cAMP-binding protein